MQTSIDEMIKDIKERKCYLIGVCGIPGSGKSHVSQLLHKRLEKSIIIPMDGFHLYRKDLDNQGIRFRGAAFTFDLLSFKKKILSLSQRKTYPISFPSFDHALKDPIQNSIIVQSGIQHVIVEGLYLFDKSLQLDCWEYKIWVQTEIGIAMDRVAKRHFKCGIEPDMERSVIRANDNDRKNGLYVQNNTNYHQCHTIANNFIIN